MLGGDGDSAGSGSVFSFAMHPRAAELIEKLRLEPHPEGGFYREIFRSKELVSPADGRPTRASLTTIYFLLTRGTWSRWHRVRSDEVWHLYEGGPLELVEADLDMGTLERRWLAPIGDDGAPVHTIPARRWQAARPIGAYALMGCTVGPGFDYADFEMLAYDPRRARTLEDGWPELASML
jgi:predicted cupin superfamily sugar epimerase